MKIPEQWKTKFEAESTHKTNPLNTMALIGVSLMWGHMLVLISYMVLTTNFSNTNGRIWI